MRLNIRDLLIIRPIGVDQTQLVEVTARAGKNDTTDVFLGRFGRRRTNSR